MRRYLILLAALASCGGSPSVNQCDTAQLAFQCHVTQVDQCVEFTGLSTADSHSANDFCDSLHGFFGDIACSSDDRVGSCVIPPATPSAKISCSPAATITVRYFPPLATAQARASCEALPGAVFSAN
jgi:hypothetical protein